MFQRIIDIHGRLSDLNAVWFPFLFLKLQPQQKIDLIHLLKMVLCFGVYFGLAYCVKALLFSEQVDVKLFLEMSLKGCLGFLIWFSVVTRPLWNKRASQIEAQR